MTLIFVDMYLDGSDSPSLTHFLCVLLEVGHCGVRLDVDNTLPDGTAAITLFRFTILANDSYLLLLHGSASLLLYHRFDGIIVLLEGDTLQVGYHIRFIVMTQFGTHIQSAWVQRGDIISVPPVMTFTLLDVAGLYVVGCFCCCTHITILCFYDFMKI